MPAPLTIITPVKNNQNVIEGKISKSVAGAKANSGYVNFDEIQITPKFQSSDIKVNKFQMP